MTSYDELHEEIATVIDNAFDDYGNGGGIVIDELVAQILGVLRGYKGFDEILHEMEM